MAIEEQVRAYGGPRLQLTQQVLNRFAEAIQVSQVDVVPKILIAGQAGKDGRSPMTGNVMEALLTLMMSERLGGDGGVISTPRNASADAIRKRIEGDMSADARLKNTQGADQQWSVPWDHIRWQ